MDNKQTIYTVNALCGAGKTFSAIQHAITLAAAGERVVIAQPTVDLSKESKADCQSRLGIHHVKITLINRSNTASVKEAVKKHLSTPCETSEILFITHSAWALVCDDGWQNKQNWHLIIDEVPPVDKNFRVNVPDNHDIFTKHLRTGFKNSDGYSQLTIRPASHAVIEEVAHNQSQDVINKIFQELATHLVSPYWKVWVEDDTYNNLVSSGKGQLNASSILQPDIVAGFKSVTVMSALFTDTNLNHIWKKMGVDFVEHPVIPQGLQYLAHTNGGSVEIRYMYDALYSKHQDDIHDLFGLMVNAVKKETASDEAFVWLANKHKTDDPFVGMEGKRLPNTPHGQNGFMKYHKIAFLPALNQTPFHGAFLKSMGFDDDGLQRALALQSTYQACMRTSIRKLDCHHPKVIYVFSKQVAVWLQQIFVGSTICKIPSLPIIEFKAPGRPEIHKTRSDRKEARRLNQARYRAKKRDKDSR